MEVTELTLHLGLLFLPGIICALIVEKLSPNREWPTARFVLYSFVLGLASYLIYALLQSLSYPLLHSVFCWKWPPPWKWPPSVHLFRSLNQHEDLDPTEILLTTIVSFFVGLVVSRGLNKHWLNRLARRMRASVKFGALDVWAHILNSDDVEWVVVRDFERDLAYEGKVDSYSETYDVNELLLQDVKVYRNSTAEPLYEVKAVYLTRQKDDLTIEIR